MKEKHKHGYQIASKGKRFLAAIVDGIILSIGLYLIFRSSFSIFLDSDFQLIEVVYYAILGIVTGAVFYPIFKGNLGHRIFNLKVISIETGEDYSKAENGAIRECIKYVSSYLFIPVIWILWDKKNQNLYDKFTKTLVVEKSENEK